MESQLSEQVGTEGCGWRSEQVGTEGCGWRSEKFGHLNAIQINYLRGVSTTFAHATVGFQGLGLLNSSDN